MSDLALSTPAESLPEQPPAPGSRPLRNKRGDTDCFIYVLVKLDACKIGISSGPQRRAAGIASIAGLRDLRLHIALPVVPRLAAEIEKQAHHAVWNQRIKGEWFAIDAAEAVSVIERAILDVTRKAAVLGRWAGDLAPVGPLDVARVFQERLARMV